MWAHPRARSARQAKPEKFGRKQDLFRSLSENLPGPCRKRRVSRNRQISWRVGRHAGQIRSIESIRDSEMDRENDGDRARRSSPTPDRSTARRESVPESPRSRSPARALARDTLIQKYYKKYGLRVLLFASLACGLYNSLYRLRYCIQ